VWGNGRLERDRVDLGIVELAAGFSLQRQGIAVHELTTDTIAACRDGLETDCAATRSPKGSQQAGSDDCLADAGIRAGDEEDPGRGFQHCDYN
jgi:hypothetical protein